ncbi:MAG: DUF1566 domain-containing protein [Planctomycetes bacterium]|nr:DUF1566 domain-containing protein [Planctomycetota bacterium]
MPPYTPHQPPHYPPDLTPPQPYIPPAWHEKLDATHRFFNRFELVLDGAAVLDKETGLVWERYPEPQAFTWNLAVWYCYDRTIGGRKGWRLPTIEELASLVDESREVYSGKEEEWEEGKIPALPPGHPFIGVQPGFYWSATTYTPPWPAPAGVGARDAWGVDFGVMHYFDFERHGAVYGSAKSNERYVWLVRGGHGYDAY